MIIYGKICQWTEAVNQYGSCFSDMGKKQTNPGFSLIYECKLQRMIWLMACYDMILLQFLHKVKTGRLIYKNRLTINFKCDLSRNHIDLLSKQSLDLMQVIFLLVMQEYHSLDTYVSEHVVKFA